MLSKARLDAALQSFAWAVLGFMVLVILQGALVRVTGSGAGCGNHWPLCNGDFFPHHPRLATLIEYAHRSMTGLLTTLVGALVAGVYRLRTKGDRTRRAAAWVAVLLITEALLGAVLVKGGYVEANTSTMRVVMQCIHFTNTMLLVASLSLTAWWLRPRSMDAVAGDAVAGDAVAGDAVAGAHGGKLALSAIVLTLLVGATGSVAALADTLFPSPSLRAGLVDDFAATAPLIVRMRWVHPAASVLALLCIGALCRRVRTPLSKLVACLLGSQFVLGIADVLLLAPAWMQVLHLLGADLFWISLVVLASESFPPQETVKSESAPQKQRAIVISG